MLLCFPVRTSTNWVVCFSCPHHITIAPPASLDLPGPLAAFFALTKGAIAPLLTAKDFLCLRTTPSSVIALPIDIAPVQFCCERLHSGFSAGTMPQHGTVVGELSSRTQTVALMRQQWPWSVWSEIVKMSVYIVAAQACAVPPTPPPSTLLDVLHAYAPVNRRIAVTYRTNNLM